MPKVTPAVKALDCDIRCCMSTLRREKNLGIPRQYARGTPIIMLALLEASRPRIGVALT